MNTKSTAIICATILIICIAFWPTLYKYDKVTAGGMSLPIRINRVTGHTATFFGGKWIRQNETKNKTSEEIPPDEGAKVTGNSGISYGEFRASIYNGSSWIIDELVITISAKDKNGGTSWNRKFRNKPSAEIDPLTTGHISFSIADDNVQNYEWNIAEVRGRKAN